MAERAERKTFREGAIIDEDRYTKF